MKYCYINKEGNTRFVKTFEALKLACKNGYAKEAYVKTSKKWEKIF